MHALRLFLRDHRRLAAALFALTLAMKALLPAGYMLGDGSRSLTVQICSDATGQTMAQAIAIPQSGKHDGTGEHGKADGTCPFSSLAMASLSGADTVLLAAALAFILALGFAPTRSPRPRRASHLRPPLRGPPALA